MRIHTGVLRACDTPFIPSKMRFLGRDGLLKYFIFQWKKGSNQENPGLSSQQSTRSKECVLSCLIQRDLFLPNVNNVLVVVEFQIAVSIRNLYFVRPRECVVEEVTDQGSAPLAATSLVSLNGHPPSLLNYAPTSIENRPHAAVLQGQLISSTNFPTASIISSTTSRGNLWSFFTFLTC